VFVPLVYTQLTRVLKSPASTGTGKGSIPRVLIHVLAKVLPRAEHLLAQVTFKQAAACVVFLYVPVQMLLVSVYPKAFAVWAF
jgi:hypothetical protein